MAKVTPLKTAAEQALIAAANARAAADGSAARGLRDAAARHFENTGLPHRRVEEWKYTDLKASLREAKPLDLPTDAAAASAIAARTLLDGAVRLFVIDGVFRADLSDLAGLPAGVTAGSLKDLLGSGSEAEIAALSGPLVAHGDPIIALNAALMTDGVVVKVAAGAAVATPIVIVQAITPGAARGVHTRSLVDVGAGASVAIVEVLEADQAGHQQTSMLNFVVADGAKVEHLVIRAADFSAVNVGTLTAVLGAHVEFASFALQSVGDIARRQLFVRMQGDHSKLALRGATMLDGRRHADTTLVVDHASLHCESRELFRTVVDEAAQGVFQGKIIVRHGAQKTDGQMASNALLLSDEAEMANKPELEIFADDVACGHGATCGEIDERLVFYLMSRGVPRKEAEALLIQSFLGEVIDEVGSVLGEDHGGALRDILTGHLEAWLAARAARG
ncbi:Fe-S cluster assembly protein SufD [Methyloraptor flagellatus]|uniref:Fe-S cluster assembly protein SufD n=1 Tax=Methyloraptor flagellatus TaxID=3162530 RepID=A0AAU7XEJ0_9HYPH